jgi:hypothetical protein
LGEKTPSRACLWVRLCWGCWEEEEESRVALATHVNSEKMMPMVEIERARGQVGTRIYDNCHAISIRKPTEPSRDPRWEVKVRNKSLVEVSIWGFWHYGVWNEDFVRARQAIPPVLLSLNLFFFRVLHFCWGPVLDLNPPTYTSCGAGITDRYYHIQLFVEMGVSLTFCPGWPPISSHLLKITDVCHHTQPRS